VLTGSTTPAGVPRGQDAVPPRDTPGSGGPRSLAGETVSRPGTAAAPGHDEPRTFADVNLNVCMTYAALYVWPLAGWGADPQGISHSSRLCSFPLQPRCHRPPTQLRKARRTRVRFTHQPMRVLSRRCAELRSGPCNRWLR